LADFDVFKSLFEPFHDNWNILFYEGVAECGVWGWEFLAKLLDEGDDFGFNLSVDHDLFNLSNDGLAHGAGDTVSTAEVVIVGAETKLLADFKMFKSLFEPLHDNWDILFNKGIAKCGVWGWELVAKLFNKSDDFGFNLSVDHDLFNLSNDGLAHGAGDTVDVTDNAIVGAETKLLADFKMFKSLFEPLHDNWDILFNKGVAKCGVWGWELVAKLFNKSDDFGFNLSVDHDLFNLSNDGLAHGAGDAISSTEASVNIFTETKLVADLKVSDALVDPCDDLWNVISNDSVAD